MSKIIDYYNRYDEDARLERDNYHRTEFLVTLRLLKPYLTPGARILDAGAGTGRYSLFFAERGYEVTALDLTPKYVELIRHKAADAGLDDKITAVCGSAVSLDRFEDGAFDAVFCMGPLYHLDSPESREACVSECLRVLKPGGILAAAYVNRAGVYLYKLMRSPETLTEQPPSTVLGPESSLDDGCFVSLSPDEVEELMGRFPILKKEHAATDGLSAVMQHTVNRLDEEQFDGWLDYMYQTGRSTYFLGSSLHSLYIAEKI
jgi:SAM-dependent methyltransferase